MKAVKWWPLGCRRFFAEKGIRLANGERHHSPAGIAGGARGKRRSPLPEREQRLPAGIRDCV